MGARATGANFWKALPADWLNRLKIPELIQILPEIRTTDHSEAVM
jgi:hypothetical protein